MTVSIPESFLTINEAPPLDAPEITLKSSPPERRYPLMAGLGPMYDASILPANSDSIADGPALNLNVSTVTLSLKVF